jgi:hypothetical protein
MRPAEGCPGDTLEGDIVVEIGQGDAHRLTTAHGLDGGDEFHTVVRVEEVHLPVLGCPWEDDRHTLFGNNRLEVFQQPQPEICTHT